MLYCLSVHPNIQTSPESAAPALVPMSLVYQAASSTLGFTSVFSTSSDRTFEESGTAVTGEDTIVFTRGVVTTHTAGNVVQDTARGAWGRAATKAKLHSYRRIVKNHLGSLLAGSVASTLLLTDNGEPSTLSILGRQDLISLVEPPPLVGSGR